MERRASNGRLTAAVLSLSLSHDHSFVDQIYFSVGDCVALPSIAASIICTTEGRAVRFCDRHFDQK